MEILGHCLHEMQITTSEGRELLGGPACFYRPKGSTLHEVSKGCWYYCCTLMAFGSLLASSYE